MLLKEFKYSVIIFFLGVIFNTAIISILYWIFIVHKFSPALIRSEFIPSTIIIILLILTYFIKKRLLDYFDVPPPRKTVTLLSSMFGTLLIIGLVMNFLNDYNYKTKKIAKIEDFYNPESNCVKIDSFEIINQPSASSHFIEKRKRKRGVDAYYQLFFLYPFKSKDHNFYYALKFEKRINNSLFEEELKVQYDHFLKETKDSLKNHNFQSTHNFVYISPIDSDYDQFFRALPLNNENAIFLQPTAQFIKTDRKDSVLQLVTGFVIILMIYIAIFFISGIRRKE